MTKQITFLLMLFMALTIGESVYAQGFLKKIKKHVQDKIEQKSEEKVDEAVDRKIDQVYDSIGNQNSQSSQTDEQRQQQRMQNLMKGMGMSGEPVPIDDNYSFNSKLQMHVESYDKTGKKESDGEFITYINPGMQNFAYQFIGGDMDQQGDGMFIMDFKNKAMIILSDQKGDKNGIVYGFDAKGISDSIMNDDAYKDMENGDVKDLPMSPYVTKTGRTKTIEGYRCEEYKYDNPDDETKAIFWISKDVNIETRDFMGTLMRSATYSHGMPWGFVMESESEDTKTGERSIMKVTDIDTKSNTKFSMSDYQITNLGSMKMPSNSEGSQEE
ncbi:MAG TPA: hypothetical protein VKA27_08090 [Sunxiuqinia sp.]|nr:hypothetical protein [Sunxiuqinia sp.]